MPLTRTRVSRQYDVGVGIAEVTDPAVGLHLQGMADPTQIAAGVESPLYARAFVVEDSQTKRRVAIVIADIWSGTRLIKTQLVERLTQRFPGAYSDENVLLAGTHTHSAPGGYSGTKLYDYNPGTDLLGVFDPYKPGGRDQTVADCIVSGCAEAVAMATESLAPGRIYVNRGPVADCGRNRSVPAYQRNPKPERDGYGADTDTEMLLLKFVRLGAANVEEPIGALSWYAIHPTDRGQKNRLVSGDNKGHASMLFERELSTQLGRRFVAAFANANCGDVSGSVELGRIPDGKTDKAQMEKHGRQQFEVAAQLFSGARERVTGPVDFRHTRVDFSKALVPGVAGARTFPAALGVSFAAGSREDSTPAPDLLVIQEGITTDNAGVVQHIQRTVAWKVLSETFGLRTVEGKESAEAQLMQAHAPKYVVFAPGLLSPPAVPHVLPVQLLRLGTVAVPGIPAELTTMAGRRLRTTVLDALSAKGVEHVALGTYANDYAQYITTVEEYGAQHYEGASTLFGPHTLEAFRAVMSALATAMAQGGTVPPGPDPGGFTAPLTKPFRFRNLSASAVELRFYNVDDTVRLATLPNGQQKIAARGELWRPQREFGGKERVAVYDAKGNRCGVMSAGQLLTIQADGKTSIGAYSPPPRV